MVEEQLAYYYETDDGRIETVTPTEFEKLIGESIYVPEPPEPLVTTNEGVEWPGDAANESERATANREKLVAGIDRLETLESQFVIDEMTSFRQMLIDLNNKKKIYDGILQMESSKAIADPARINKIADAYDELIESLQKHEQAIQKYLQQ